MRDCCGPGTSGSRLSLPWTGCSMPRRHRVRDGPRKDGHRHDGETEPRTEIPDPAPAPRGHGGGEGARQDEEGRHALDPERRRHAGIEPDEVRGPRPDGTERPEKEVERPGQRRGQRHVGQDLMAVQEESGARGQHGDGDETGRRPREQAADGEHTGEGNERRDHGGNRGGALGNLPARPGDERHAPEVERRLVEVRRLANVSGETETTLQGVAGEQGHPGLVLAPQGAVAER